MSISMCTECVINIKVHYEVMFDLRWVSNDSFSFFSSLDNDELDIHCLRTSTLETFTAFLQLPPGFEARPVLEELEGETLPDECIISETNIPGA